MCYGLGSFCTNSNAVKQLALSINVYEELRSRLGEGCIRSLNIYDPAMTETDEEIARDSGMNVLKVNERGFHKAECSTIFIMPHCGRQLYHNALVANLACCYLDNIVIVGNSFQTYNISIMKSIERRQSAIIAMLPYTSETSLNFDVPKTDPHYFQYESAFSDLRYAGFAHLFQCELSGLNFVSSVHTFSKVSMETALEDPAVQCILENSLPDASDDEVLTH
uniref:Protein kinase putative n=1 Tax=Albugo laibachii Nc14 TaxID=890382 RepID=F0W3X6_9STRA|nr:protein kinase putative [Albugo laibachii Nc14]|eukprot:CCA15771.1 protein kinase putative [Albugo laibachii Nc14]